MEFYNDPLKVDEYEKMCDEYDGFELYKVLSNHLPENSSLLELGCGPGNDIIHLKNRYNITGSDLSDEFLLRCRKRFPDLSFIKLDAESITTEKGKILPRRLTGCCAKHQRNLASVIKRSRAAALMPFKAEL